MGWVSITLPELGGNIVYNPSAEADGNFAAIGATVTRDVAHARFGNHAYKIVQSGTNQGNSLTTKAAANAAHYTTFYVWGTITGTMQVCLDGTNWDNAAIVGGSAGGFVRYGVAIPAARANGSTTTRIRDTANDGTWWLDGVLTEPTSGYFTTYTDGDQDGCVWDGLRHGSKSTRSAQYRLGGRERDLLTDYQITVRQMAGYGLPPIQQNTMPYTLLPGSEFQGDHIGQRTVVLTFNLSDTTIPLLQSKRKKLMNFLYPGAYAGSQPVRLGFKSQHTGRTVYGNFRYVDGLGGQALQAGGSAIEGNAETKVTLVACDPFFYEDNAETAALTLQQAVTQNFGAARIQGAWNMLGTGFGFTVYCILVDKQRGRVYFGGKFLDANGVTVNRFCYWNGDTFVAVGGATKGVAGGDVFNLALAPNGDVWGVGDVTSAGGTATKGVFRYNVATDTFTCFNLSVTGTAWRHVAIDRNGLVYLGGDMLNWNGDAAQDYVVSFDGINWAAVGTSPFTATDKPTGTGSAMAIDANNTLIVGSRGLSGAAGAVRRWTGTAWVTLASTSADGVINCVLVRPDNNILVGGLFATLGGVAAVNVGEITSSTVLPLSTGTDAVVNNLCQTESGLIVLGGDFGMMATSKFSYWNGYIFSSIDALLVNTGNAVAALGDDLYFGTQAGTTTTVAAQTTVTPTSTAETKPIIILTGPTTAGASCTLRWLENQSTDERLYFNLTVQAGETVIIDCEALTVTSDWRGQLVDQPLEGSDWAVFHLLPQCANTLAAFVTGTVTGATLTAHWPVTHNATDGGAA